MRTKFFLMLVIILLTCNLAMAQSETVNKPGLLGWGPRIGISVDPDQFFFGGQADYGYFLKTIRLQPNFEIGFGDSATLVAINFDAAFRPIQTESSWMPYLGGGISVNFYSGEKYYGSNEIDTKGGISAIAGIGREWSNGRRFFLEFKLGIIKSPDIKILVGGSFLH
jgi:hypothetical protein